MRASNFAGVLAAGLFSHAASADVVRGVNMGGWLVTEPWLTPSIFSETNTTSEWALCNALGKDKCLKTLEDHWANFYSRDDLSAIKQAGLTAVRIPLGYWAVDLLDFEPYVSGQYPYLVRAVQWARDLGLKVMIDLHGVPGSQNGWEESGIVGAIDFPANSSNTDRSINVLKNLTQEFTKDIYKGAVTNIELMNEPIFGMDLLKKFYTAASEVVSPAIEKGINITIHDGFFNPHSWANYDPANADATSPAPGITIDTHQFWAFPPLDTLGEDEILEAICNFSTQLRNATVSGIKGIPPTLVGEWALSTGITANSTSNTEQDQDKRTWFRKLFESQNAAFTPNGPNQPSIGWYFWAWKTEYDIDAWSYRKGLADGYIPTNISDPSTYAFPRLDSGCIDPTFKYTANKTITPQNTGTPSSSGSGASHTKKGSASGLTPTSVLTVAAVVCLGMFSLA